MIKISSNKKLKQIERKKNNNFFIFCFKKIIELDPQNMEAYMNQGLLYSKLKNYSKSIKYYNKAIEIMPNDPCVHMG